LKAKFKFRASLPILRIVERSVRLTLTGARANSERFQESHALVCLIQGRPSLMLLST